MTKARKLPIGLGEAAPWFRAAALSGAEKYAFDSAAGQAVLMLFFGSARDPASAAALAQVQERRALFDDKAAAFFGITLDPEDVGRGADRPAASRHPLLPRL